MGRCVGSTAIKIIMGTVPVLGWLAGIALEPFIMLLPGLIYLAARDEQNKTSGAGAISS